MRSPLSVIFFSTAFSEAGIHRMPYYDCLIVAWSTGNCCYFLELVQFFDSLILLHTLLPPSWMCICDSRRQSHTAWWRDEQEE